MGSLSSSVGGQRKNNKDIDLIEIKLKKVLTFLVPTPYIIKP